MSLGQLAEMGTLQQKGSSHLSFPGVLHRLVLRPAGSCGERGGRGGGDESLRKIRELLQVTDHEKCGEAMGVSPVHGRNFKRTDGVTRALFFFLGSVTTP
ncbi:hypothetical protein NFI96_025325 [Prochilodus magdalenae]|nr:hypothetical protein NFI96_025325 [Prochilodus magdalenae]